MAATELHLFLSLVYHTLTRLTRQKDRNLCMQSWGIFFTSCRKVLRQSMDFCFRFPCARCYIHFENISTLKLHFLQICRFQDGSWCNKNFFCSFIFTMLDLWPALAVVYSFHTWDQQECGNARVKRCWLCLYTAYSPGGASRQPAAYINPFCNHCRAVCKWHTQKKCSKKSYCSQKRNLVCQLTTTRKGRKLYSLQNWFTHKSAIQYHSPVYSLTSFKPPQSLFNHLLHVPCF